MEKVPADLRRAITTASRTKDLWQGLTPVARRDFIGWVESAKLPETRKRRIERVPSMLKSGKRRPCCYAIVPMNLYKALGESPKAKATWSSLTPDERRDFVAWVDQAKAGEGRMIRVAKTCAMLARGKRRP